MYSPDTRYMGSKRKLLPELSAVFSQLKFSSALDAFSGTASVAYMLKSMGKRVHTNDYLMFNYYYAQAMIENSSVQLSEDDIAELIEWNDDRDDLIAREFTGLYFSKRDCEWLDSVMANIRFLHNPYQRALALSALCRACIKKRPRGIFTYTGMRYDDGRRDLQMSLAEHFTLAVRALNECVFDNRFKHRSFCKDVMQLREVKYDLIYLDPPYFSMKSDNEYSRRYHFLEGLVSYWTHVKIDRTTKTKKIYRVDSPFTHRNRVRAAFEELFDRFKASQLVVSYSSNSLPIAADMRAMLRNAGKSVEMIELDHVYSVGTHSHRKQNASNRVKEYVFLGL